MFLNTDYPMIPGLILLAACFTESDCTQQVCVSPLFFQEVTEITTKMLWKKTYNDSACKLKYASQNVKNLKDTD